MGNKTFISTIFSILWLLFGFLSMKTDANKPSKEEAKNFEKKIIFIWHLVSHWRKSKGSGSVSQWNGQVDADPYQKVIVLAKFFVCQSLCKPHPLFRPDRIAINYLYLLHPFSCDTPSKQKYKSSTSEYGYLLLPGMNKLKGQWPKCDRYWLVSRPSFP
jgi:hypothetical protein